VENSEALLYGLHTTILLQWNFLCGLELRGSVIPKISHFSRRIFDQRNIWESFGTSRTKFCNLWQNITQNGRLAK